MDAVREVVPIARLSCPPGLPSTLAGFLALDGQQVPVLRLARLLGLPEVSIGLYTPLIVLRGADRGEAGLALLVDRVRAVVSGGSHSPLERTHSFNGCARSLLQVENELVPVLAPGRLLLEEERHRIADFERLTRERLAAWDAPAGELQPEDGAAA